MVGMATRRGSMIRQFLRLYLTVMIPVLVLVGLAHHYGSHANTRTAYIEGVRTGLQQRFTRTRHLISAMKLDDWEASLPKLREEFPDDLQIDVASLAVRRLKSNAEETARFERGDVAFVVRRRGITRAYQAIPGTPLVLGSTLVVPSDRDYSGTLYVLAAVAVVSLLVLWLWFHPSWLALERLEVLAEDVAIEPRSRGAAYGTGRFGQPFSHEIDRVSARLDDMLRLRNTQNSTIAHELTTPIAKLTMALEILKENPQAASNEEVVAHMREDLHELDQLVAESLDFAKLSSSKSLKPTKASVTTLMQIAVDGALTLSRHGRQITAAPFDGDGDRVFCDARQINRALSNLLRNAVRHARSTVTVSAEAVGDVMWIHVDDDGAGISEEDRSRLFEPFQRGRDPTVEATRGHGLGLAIVQQIAELHGGVARIDASPLGGARVSIGW